MVKARWYAGKVIHKTLATTEAGIEYLKLHGIEYRVRKVKTGYKLDMKLKN